MKYLIILPGGLPFPPIMGGATENLVNYYIEDNELNNKNQYLIVSSYVKNIEKYKNNYKNCKLIYVNQNSILFKIKKVIFYLLRKFIKIDIPNAYLSYALEKIKGENFDKIIIENNPEYGYFLRKIYKNKKIYLHLHNDSLGVSNIKYASCYDKIICVSDFITNKIKKINSNLNVVTLYNAIELEKYLNINIDKEKICKKYGLITNKKIVMYVGRIQENKGVLDLIKAFKKSNINKDMQLVLVGGTFFKNSKPDKFYRLIKSIVNEDSSIILTGYVDYKDIPELMSCSDIGVIPSKCNEAFGLTLLEFMAVGKPTIITNDGALKELGNNETSIIVNCEKDISSQLSNSITKLAKKTTNLNLEKMSKVAREKAKEFSISRYVKKFNEYVGD